MNKKVISLLLAAALMLAATASGCSDDQPTAQNSVSSKNSSSTKSTSGLSMSVSSNDGKMNISRAQRKNASMGENDTWTIFVYLCGTNLESSGQASATSDLLQVLEADSGDNVKFVVQTGGTSEWINDLVSADETQRYLLQNQDIELVDSVPLANMGESDTLKDFLSWGVKNYPADKMGVIFWNHGSGSINGVCFDELYDKDSLSLPEINTALSSVYDDMTDQFEFIGFDACLMGTIETANILSTYARYMYGSQECEPGNGWDYTAIGNALADNPSQNGGELGKIIADSFYEECKLSDDEDSSTLTVVDLQKTDDFIVAFNDFSNQLYQASLNNSKLTSIVRGINNAANLGGNNKSEGYTNMVDVGGILKGCSKIADADTALKALKNCIVYNKNGRDHKKASGLSIYYPIQVEGSDELNMFASVAISPYYLSIVDIIANGYSEDSYDNSAFFSDDGTWNCDNCEYQDFDEDYFGYADDTEDTDSELITFSEEPSIDEDGSFYFTLDEDGLSYTSDVTALLYMDIDGELLELGESYDIYADWESGTFSDNFDGYWLSLPNGQLLPTYIVDVTDDYVIYTSPIYLNGKRTNLRFRQNDDEIIVEGAWDGITDSVAAKGVQKLKKGDKIEVVYYISDDSEIRADVYKWNDGDNIIYEYLPESDYYYSFCIEDIYGDYYFTDDALFSIDENGEIFFTDLSEDD